MSTKTFAYQWANQEELNDHVLRLSKQAITAVLKRYRQAGNTKLVHRIELAVINAKISGLMTQAELLSEIASCDAG